MATKKLVIVESPTKAKTIRKFLGSDYIVESCMGHIRDLPQSSKDIPDKYKKEPWSQLGVNVDKDFDPIYLVPKQKAKVVRELREKLQGASELLLATDEDREGESISWHLLEVLKPKVPVKRMVFHEITKKAIEKSLKEFRPLNDNLVRAQEARRILDRLVGYTISPLLWKKVAYGLSAGRVQSVAVRLIVEKELDRIRFKVTDYAGVLANCQHRGAQFEARLTAVADERIATGKDFDPETGSLPEDSRLKKLSVADAEKIISDIRAHDLRVTEVDEKPVSRKPAAPFITSTLQQEANRKLGMSARETMQTAQKLYEQGFITYMRTDSSFLSQEAILAARDTIDKLYGAQFLPPSPRDYAAKKVKGAQEAHEAIRPAGEQFTHPDQAGLSGVQFKLYDLIWKRTVASQMVNSEHRQVSVRLAAGDATLNASGMTIVFPGYLKAYVEGSDDPESALEQREVVLPPLKVGDIVAPVTYSTTEHRTKPPARFTEASLVQKLEKEGVGRPSTYASIISTIQDRGYVKKQGNAFVPTFTAMVVSKLLKDHLPDYVDLQFTSSMEKSLDDIAQGDLDWVRYLHQIYSGAHGLKSLVEKQGAQIDEKQARAVTLPGLDSYSFRVGRYGAYVCRETPEGEEVCASLPETLVPGDMSATDAERLIETKVHGADALGVDPKTGLKVYSLAGRYGPYVQLGESDAEEARPKRVSIPATINADTITMDQALALLALPETLGTHPDTGLEVKKGLGRFGPFVVHNGEFRSIPKTDSLFELKLDRALELLAQPKSMRGRAAPLKALGRHPETGDTIEVFDGKYGYYVKCGGVNASLPENVSPDQITVEQAIELIAARKSATPAKGRQSKRSPLAAKSKLVKSSSGGAKKVKASPTRTGPSKKVSGSAVQSKVAPAKPAPPPRLVKNMESARALRGGKSDTVSKASASSGAVVRRGANQTDNF